MISKFKTPLTGHQWEKVIITEDLTFLGIKKGSYGIHELIYDHFMKCFYNEAFGTKFSDVVNFDWYHPAFAYRYELSALLDWFSQEGLQVTSTMSTTAQHFVSAKKVTRGGERQ